MATAADTYVKDSGGSLLLATLTAVLAQDEQAARDLLDRLAQTRPSQVHLLEVAAERLAELAYEKRQP